MAFEILTLHQILPAKQASMHTFGILLGYDFLDHYTTSLRYPNLFKLIDIVICTKINQLTPSYIINCPFLDFLVPEKSLKYRWISRGRLL